MNGTVRFKIETTLYTFDLAFNRNITIIRGDSGSGKSLLCTLLSESQRELSGISVTVTPNYKYIIMPTQTMNSEVVRPWYDICKNARDTVIFIDETCDCLHASKFSGVIRHTSNYYVIITRGVHADLPYSIKSIYHLVDKDRMIFIKPIVEEQQMYPELKHEGVWDAVICEDQGLEFPLEDKITQHILPTNVF